MIGFIIFPIWLIPFQDNSVQDKPVQVRPVQARPVQARPVQARSVFISFYHESKILGNFKA